MPKRTQPESGTQFWRSPHLAPSRRMFFRHLAAGVSGYWLLPQPATEAIARAAEVQTPGSGRAKQVIFIMLAGAPSQVDTFDFKEGDWTPREFAPATFGDLRFPQGLLPGLASQIGDLAFLRSVRAWAVVHGIANQWMQLARNPVSPGARIAPHIGSIVSRELAGTQEIRLPAFFALNAVGGQEPGGGFLPAEHAPILLQPAAAGGGLSPQTEFMDREAYRRRRALLERIQADRQFDGAASGMAILQAGARELLFDDRVEAMFRFTEAESARYGATAFGNSCLIARNLIASRQGVRYVEITHPGWDHHADIYHSMPALAREFDRGLATLLADLRTGGLLDETLVVAMGEFGRTVGALNGLAGRDHYQQQSVMLAGAGIRGGRAIGATNATGAFTSEPGWSGNRNIRPEDIAATIYSSLGIDWTKSVHTESGARFDYLPATGDAPYVPVVELWR
jgi:hypothetical protein